MTGLEFKVEQAPENIGKGPFWYLILYLALICNSEAKRNHSVLICLVRYGLISNPGLSKSPDYISFLEFWMIQNMGYSLCSPELLNPSNIYPLNRNTFVPAIL